MKNLFCTLFMLVTAIGCGNDKGPDQTHISQDERSGVVSTSVTDAIESSKNNDELLKGVTFKQDTCENNNILRDVLLFGDKIKSLDGEVLDLDNYGSDEIEFQKFLSDSGVRSIGAIDIANSGTKRTMYSCNLPNMIPPKSCWYRTLTFSLLKDKIEDHSGTKTTLTSHYRNDCYNKELGGSKKSDHLSAKAMDIAMKDQESRHSVEKFICENLWKENYFINSKTDSLSNISIGLGKTFIHLGIESVHGRRHWIYDDYAQGNNMSSTCWRIRK